MRVFEFPQAGPVPSAGRGQCMDKAPLGCSHLRRWINESPDVGRIGCWRQGGTDPDDSGRTEQEGL